MPRHATPRHATPRHATPRHATPRHATPRHVTPRHAMPAYLYLCLRRLLPREWWHSKGGSPRRQRLASSQVGRRICLQSAPFKAHHPESGIWSAPASWGWRHDGTACRDDRNQQLPHYDIPSVALHSRDEQFPAFASTCATRRTHLSQQRWHPPLLVCAPAPPTTGGPPPTLQRPLAVLLGYRRTQS